MAKFFRKKNKLPLEREHFLSLFSGVESGLATTSAIVAGLVASGTREVSDLVTIAIISFAVQAFNGAVGRFSSEHTNDEIDDIEDEEGYKKPIIDAVLQFIAHIGFSLLILIPFAYISNVFGATAIMVTLTFTLMFSAGAVKGVLVHNEVKKDGTEMVYMAILVIIVGTLAGWIVK